MSELWFERSEICGVIQATLRAMHRADGKARQLVMEISPDRVSHSRLHERDVVWRRQRVQYLMRECFGKVISHLHELPTERKSVVRQLVQYMAFIGREAIDPRWWREAANHCSVLILYVASKLEATEGEKLLNDWLEVIEKAADCRTYHVQVDTVRKCLTEAENIHGHECFRQMQNALNDGSIRDAAMHVVWFYETAHAENHTENDTLLHLACDTLKRMDFSIHPSS